MGAVRAQVVVASTLLSVLACCGGSLSDSEGGSGADAGASSFDADTDTDAGARNACGGEVPLQFLTSTKVAPGDPCGQCSNGALICVSPNALACAGAKNDCADGSATANACGGTGPLSNSGGDGGILLDGGVDAQPGDACGTCGDGTLICETPSLLDCLGASPATLCVDAGSDGGTDAGVDAGPPCVIPSSAFTAGSPTLPTLATETPPASTTFTTLALETNDLLYNPFDGLLYVSVPNGAATLANTIAVIDPVTATVLANVAIGTNPTTLAISDDGSTIWAGLKGTSQVRAFDVATRMAGITFDLGANTYATDLRVLPGTKNTLVVSLANLGFTGGETIAVFDTGISRAASIGANIGAETTEVIATNAPTLVYGGSSISSLKRYCIDERGIFFVETPGVFGGNELTFEDNVLYGDNGIVFDQADEVFLGVYDIENVSWASVAPDSAAGRSYVLETPFSTTNLKIVAFDQARFVPLASDTYANPVGLVGKTLVRWGRYGFAFRAVPFGIGTTNAKVFIARSTLIPTTP